MLADSLPSCTRSLERGQLTLAREGELRDLRGPAKNSGGERNEMA